MEEYKIHDKVVVVRGMSKGEQATILDPHNDKFYVFVQIVRSGRKRYYSKSCIELITKESYPELYI